MISRIKNKRLRRTLLWCSVLFIISTTSIFIFTYGIDYYRTFYACSGVEIDQYRYPILGIDVSSHQEEIEWNKVYDANVKFAFIKATEGEDFVDKRFKKNWQEAKNNQILVGAYHFFRFSKSGKTQAENFIKNVELTSMDLPAVLDVEMYGNIFSSMSYSQTKIVSEIFIYLREIEKHYSVKPIIYTNTDTYNRFIKNNFEDYDVWICKLCTEPTDWKWKFWQYSHKGSMPGIKTDVDLNTFNGSYNDLIQYIHKKNHAKESFDNR